MLEREGVIAELWSRLATVTGVTYTARNPKAEPSADNFSAIQFFELQDVVESETKRGGYPAYRRMLKVAVEGFISASAEGAATKEIGLFAIEIKKKVYAGGVTLGGRCKISESETSRIMRPPTGEHSIGIGIIFEIRYTENIASIM